MPVRGHERRGLQQLLGLQGAPLKPDRPLRWLEPSERPHQFGLAVALHAGDTDDLPARNVEAYVLEAFAAEAAYREVHIGRDAFRLRRKRRAERPADDQVQDFRIRDLADGTAAANFAIAKHRD